MLETPEHVETVARFQNDPLGYVLWAWPGVELERWQRTALTMLSEDLKARVLANAEDIAAVRLAVSAGNGAGVDALCSWCTLWSASTEPRPHIQHGFPLNRQMEIFRSEFEKWRHQARNGDWFTSSKHYLHRKDDLDLPVASFLIAEHQKAERFAGTMTSVFAVFHDAQQIPPSVWEVVEGAMQANPFSIWLATGLPQISPKDPVTQFRQCFDVGGYGAMWAAMQVDTSETKRVRPEQIEHWIAEFGKDSDFVRARVRGEWPKVKWARMQRSL